MIATESDPGGRRGGGLVVCSGEHDDRANGTPVPAQSSDRVWGRRDPLFDRPNQPLQGLKLRRQHDDTGGRRRTPLVALKGAEAAIKRLAIERLTAARPSGGSTHV